MKTTRLNNLTENIDKHIRVQGFVASIRDQKNMAFLTIKTQDGILQIAHYKPSSEKLSETISALTSGSTVDVVGKLIKNSKVRQGGVELNPESSIIINKNTAQEGNMFATV